MQLPDVEYVKRYVQNDVWCNWCNRHRTGYHTLQVTATGVSMYVCICNDCVKEMAQTIDREELETRQKDEQVMSTYS